MHRAADDRPHRVPKVDGIRDGQPRRATSNLVRRALGVSLLTATVAACGRDAAPDPLADSGLPSYVVGEDPALVLEDDGTPEKLFASISARRMPGGEIVVADQGSSAIHVFGRDGRVANRLARRGDGPGELQGAFLATSVADTVFVFGRPPMSPPDVSVYGADSGFLSRFRPAAGNARALTVLDRLSTGHLVVQRGWLGRVVREAPELGVLIPDSITYGFYEPSGHGAPGDVVWLPPVQHEWMFAYPWPNGPIPTAASSYPLRGATTAVVSDDRLWLIDMEVGRIRAVDVTGREIVTADLELDAEPFDRAVLEKRRAEGLAAAVRARDSSRVQALYDPKLLPPTAPLGSAAYAGANGEVWIRLFDLDDNSPQRFVIVDRDGRTIARASLPSELDVQHIGADFVLGIRRDSLGVESVHEYTLRRP